MLTVVEESELKKIQNQIKGLEKDFERQSNKMSAIIDAIGEAFKEIRKDSEDGIPTVDSDLYCVNPYEAESELREMVIYNLEYKLMKKIDKVREDYKMAK